MPAQTIAALATAAGPAGVAVIRISGPEAFTVADRVARCAGHPPSQRPAGTFFHATFATGAAGEALDDGLVLIFRAPRSYTGEDTVELQGHGGPVVARQVLQAVFHAGAHPAGPGEFTRRAFLNGRLDLTQAEAVLDVIQAQTGRAARAAREQAAGGLRRRVEALYARLTAVCADIETLLDFEEGAMPPRFLDAARTELGAVVTEAQGLLATWGEGHVLRDGALTVIAGRVNAGKSSLLNALLGRARAIVSESPGTTRDTIEEGYNLKGIPLRLADTAGIRDAACAVEREGIARARQLTEAADWVIYVVDGTTPPNETDREAIAALPVERMIVAVNKADRPDCADNAALAAALNLPAAVAMPRCSALTPDGARSVVEVLQAKLEASAGTHEAVAISQRHAVELTTANAAIRRAISLLNHPEGLVLAATPLREAAEALGRITGRIFSDDLLDTVFARFCVGK
ncbi:MAG: tRNA uridine-5-carboxymethylaminomethyl(34) synthesis GTPase MnmE [Lentisphaerae bacterium]|nr:tRNA uridine-5-carboxymethylaminomethyl(34) synthesis GTPase MnmE [Lentisphaerota bacterium]